jgi:transcriptional regulator with XRE-family HTH domain
MSLAENIRRLRKDKGWTQLELAEYTGLRVAHISELEKGKGDPKLSTLYKIMHAFKCSPDSLLIDQEKVTTDALLKQALERALALDEAHQRVVLHNLDMYCIAVGIIHQTNSQRSLLRFIVPPHQPLFPDPPIPPEDPETGA